LEGRSPCVYGGGRGPCRLQRWRRCLRASPATQQGEQQENHQQDNDGGGGKDGDVWQFDGARGAVSQRTIEHLVERRWRGAFGDKHNAHSGSSSFQSVTCAAVESGLASPTS